MATSSRLSSRRLSANTGLLPPLGPHTTAVFLFCITITHFVDVANHVLFRRATTAVGMTRRRPASRCRQSAKMSHSVDREAAYRLLMHHCAGGVSACAHAGACVGASPVNVCRREVNCRYRRSVRENQRCDPDGRLLKARVAGSANVSVGRSTSSACKRFLRPNPAMEG